MQKIEKLVPQNVDLIDENIAKLKAIFPQAVSENGVDYQILKALLGDEISNPYNKYNFTWANKDKVISQALKPSFSTLRPLISSSVDFYHSANAFIKADNLEALKLLANAYTNKIKMIYIDPPYNTGKDFIYKDNYKSNLKNYLSYANLLDEEGVSYSSDVDSGAKHTNWLNMIYPRLSIAYSLLRDDGVIFISIDDHEVHNLRKICDEIFGEENFIAQMVWKSKNKPSGNTTENKLIDTRTETIMVFAKDKNSVSFNKKINSKEDLIEKGYVLKDEFFSERGCYKLTSLAHSCSAGSFQYIPSLDYEIEAPDGTMFKNYLNLKQEKSYCYTWSKKLFDFGDANGFIEYKKNSEGQWVAYRKMYENCAIDNKKLEIIYRKSGNAYTNIIDHVQTDAGTNELRNLLKGNTFPFPKPTALIKHLISMVSSTTNATGGGHTCRLMSLKSS